MSEEVIVKQLAQHFEEAVIEKVYKDNVQIYNTLLENLRNFDTLSGVMAGRPKTYAKNTYKRCPNR